MESTAENIMETMAENTSKFSAMWKAFSNKVVDYLPTLIYAVIVFIVGYIIVKILMKLIARGLKKSRLDITLHGFIRSILHVTLLTLLLITVASTLGIPVTTFVTILGAAGLAVSLALQDSLKNLAGGMLILFTRPFTIGDYVEVEAQGVSGTVCEIGLVYTRLNTPDNKRIFVPNGQISNAKIINYSAEDHRRLDLTFSIGYDCDLEKAKDILRRVVEENPLALKEPEPVIRVCAHSASSIDIACRVWVDSDKYWDLNFDLYEAVKKEFDKNHIEIPFNQIDLHVKKDDLEKSS
ncbi:mechanosensitive ion channel family protein [Zongyangia hominis]|uniref:Mechanosensitive ion channel family protein n=1 Tax=Zongyangia hominis TaxID=2763677 RepID=A0A926EAC7_9FIRM|nr:mechanosensitive ion channel family protein [Zongyangia hominis]MBC8570133.1 mechanosensitive ion channel family protein [Zongyangia hominis]